MFENQASVFHIKKMSRFSGGVSGLRCTHIGSSAEQFTLRISCCIHPDVHSAMYKLNACILYLTKQCSNVLGAVSADSKSGIYQVTEEQLHVIPRVITSYAVNRFQFFSTGENSAQIMDLILFLNASNKGA
jgi:hypothetical protein